MPTLVLTPRHSEDTQALWKAAAREGWRIERLSGWHVPPSLQGIEDDIVLYVEALFGPTLAEALGVRLLDPPQDWLVRLPYRYAQRRIALTTLGEARDIGHPAFIKPPNDKSFPAAVYRGSELPQGYDEDMPVLVADVVSWRLEFRCFVLDRRLLTYSIYARHGEPQQASGFASTPDEDRAMQDFVHALLQDSQVELPQATVLDVGYIEDAGWACVELNAAWGAGLYGCDAALALQVIRRASVTIR